MHILSFDSRQKVINTKTGFIESFLSQNEPGLGNAQENQRYLRQTMSDFPVMSSDWSDFDYVSENIAHTKTKNLGHANLEIWV